MCCYLSVRHCLYSVVAFFLLSFDSLQYIDAVFLCVSLSTELYVTELCVTKLYVIELCVSCVSLSCVSLSCVSLRLADDLLAV